MSEFNNFDNQNPNNRPDYSYNWNGSEYNRNKNNKGRIAIVVFVVVAIIAVSVMAAFAAGNAFSGDNSDATSKNTSSESSNTSKENYVVPDFTPSGDSDTDLSTTLTQIYDNCSKSCCTVNVKYTGYGYSLGSGFVIDAAEGYIATNHHVIEDADEITVTFYDGTEYPAKLINSDATTDIAVLKIEAENLVQVEFGKSENIKVGENVVAIGTPYDNSLAGTMTCGIVSGIARDIDITNESGKVIKTMTLIQTDCSINPGNSGGPLIDMAGNVIGITSLKLVDEQFEGIGFAIPITDAIEIFRKLIAGEEIDGSGIASAAPQIGIQCTDVETGLAHYNLRPRGDYPTEGVFIVDIEFDSSAYGAGLSRLDIITDFNGKEIKTSDDLTNALTGCKAGEEVEITVFRFNRILTGGEYLTIKFKLDAAK